MTWMSWVFMFAFSLQVAPTKHPTDKDSSKPHSNYKADTVVPTSRPGSGAPKPTKPPTLRGSTEIGGRQDHSPFWEFSLPDIIVAMFTVVLAFVSIWQGRQIRREFLASHRPRLRLRHIEFRNEGKHSIDFTIINVGESTATFIESSVKPWLHAINEKLPPVPPYAVATSQPRTRRLANGETVRWSEVDTPEDYSLLFADVASDHVEMMLLGYIVYADDSGIRRRLGFCYRRIKGTDGFEAVPNSEYNYED